MQSEEVKAMERMDVGGCDDNDDVDAVAFVVRIRRPYDDDDGGNGAGFDGGSRRSKLRKRRRRRIRSKLGREEEDAAMVRRTASDFAAFDASLREELSTNDDDGPPLPCLPELLPSVVECDSSSDVASRRRAAEEEELHAERLGEYLASVLDRPDAVRSKSLASFLAVDYERRRGGDSIDDDKDDERDGWPLLEAAVSKMEEKDGRPKERKTHHTYHDYLLQDNNGNERSEDNVAVAIPQRGTHTATLNSVPPGWWIVWQFRLNDAGASPFGLSGGSVGTVVDFTLAIEDEFACHDEINASVDRGAEEVDCVSATTASSSSSSTSSVSSPTPRECPAPRIVHTEACSTKGGPASHRGSYRYQPEGEREEGWSTTQPAAARATLTFSVSSQCRSVLPVSLPQLLGGGRPPPPPSVRLECRAVPNDAFDAACHAAADQNALDDRRGRCPLLSSILDAVDGSPVGLAVEPLIRDGDGWDGSDDDESEEEKEMGNIKWKHRGGGPIMCKAKDDGDGTEDDRSAAVTRGGGLGEAAGMVIKWVSWGGGSGTGTNMQTRNDSSDRATEGTGANMQTRNDSSDRAPEAAQHPTAKVAEGDVSIQCVQSDPTPTALASAPVVDVALKEEEDARTLRSEIGYLRAQLEEERAARERAESVVVEVTRRNRLVESEKRVWGVARQEVEAEMARLTSNLDEEHRSRGATTARLHALEVELVMLRSRIRSEKEEERALVESENELKKAKNTIFTLQRTMEGLRNRNQGLKSKIDEERKISNDLLASAREDADEALMKVRILEGKVRSLEQIASRRRSASVDRCNNTLPDSSRLQGIQRGDRGGSSLQKQVHHSHHVNKGSSPCQPLHGTLLTFEHPDWRLNRQLIELRDRHNKLMLLLEQNPKGIDLIMKIENAIRDIVSSVERPKGCSDECSG